jgi:hypothetical protein
MTPIDFKAKKSKVKLDLRIHWHEYIDLSFSWEPSARQTSNLVHWEIIYFLECINVLSLMSAKQTVRKIFSIWYFSISHLTLTFWSQNQWYNLLIRMNQCIKFDVCQPKIFFMILSWQYINLWPFELKSNRSYLLLSMYDLFWFSCHIYVNPRCRLDNIICSVLHV